MESRFAFTCYSKWNHGNGLPLTEGEGVIVVLKCSFVEEDVKRDPTPSLTLGRGLGSLDTPRALSLRS